MAKRMLSLPDHLDEKLRGEENASALITKLLTNHYNGVYSKLDVATLATKKKYMEAVQYIDQNTRMLNGLRQDIREALTK